MKRIETIAEMIAHFGGLTNTAAAFDLPAEAGAQIVFGWRERFRLPLRSMPDHERVLRDAGVEASRTVWFPTDEQIADMKAEAEARRAAKAERVAA